MTLLTPETQLHHYTAQSGLLGILESGEFRFGSFTSTNDPFEVKNWSLSLHTDFGESVPDELHCQATDILHARRRLLHLGCFTSDVHNAPSVPKLMTARGCSHPRMWAQYADGHRGACLVFNRERLCAAVEQTATTQSGECYHELVSYVERSECWSEPFRLHVRAIREYGMVRAIDEHLMHYHRELFFQKASDWSSEGEYRFLLRLRTPGRVTVGIAGVLDGVVLGEACTTDLERLTHLLARYGVKRPLQVRWINGYPVVSDAGSSQ